MSARDALMRALWDNYTRAEKNAFIDAFARELAVGNAPTRRLGSGQEPLIHSGLTDILDDKHPLAHETTYCDGAACRGRAEMLHACNNENMTTWVEAPKGNYCLPCFTALDKADGVDGWSSA